MEQFFLLVFLALGGSAVAGSVRLKALQKMLVKLTPELSLGFSPNQEPDDCYRLLFCKS